MGYVNIHQDALVKENKKMEYNPISSLRPDTDVPLTLHQRT